MTALTHWNPLKGLGTMQNRVSSFSDWISVRNGHQEPDSEEWAPLVDVIETGDEYVIRADLPGVSKDAINVKLEGGELTLQGSRAVESLAEDERYVSNERPYGTFTRTFVVPDWADVSCIQAEFKHGVLNVRLEKPDRARARTIPIQGE